MDQNVNKTVWDYLNQHLTECRLPGMVSFIPCNLHVVHNAFRKGLSEFEDDTDSWFWFCSIIWKHLHAGRNTFLKPRNLMTKCSFGMCKAAGSLLIQLWWEWIAGMKQSFNISFKISPRLPRKARLRSLWKEMRDTEESARNWKILWSKHNSAFLRSLRWYSVASWHSSRKDNH